MLSRFQSWRTKKAWQIPRENDLPLRSELFSLDQLIHHAKKLAESHKVFIKPGSNRLLACLDENEKSLRAFNRETLAVDETRRITHAAEWLLDNFYLIEEQIQLARRHLPKSYSRELPRLLDGSSARLPRVYDIVLELISHVDAQVDVESLSAFIKSYQTVHPLKLGELWAIPIMLRLGLIENLQRVAERLKIARQHRDEADLWMTRLQDVAETNPSHLVVVMAELAQSDPSLSSSFVAEFCQRLSRQRQEMHWVRNWLEQRLSEQGEVTERLIHQESETQAADQVSISHSINSLRMLGGMEWGEFVETMSVVDETLRKDPTGVYARMDFATRDAYRHAIERVARQGNLPEWDAAEIALDLTETSAAKEGLAARSAHVGYYLIDKGRPLLDAAGRVRGPWSALLPQSIRRHPMPAYAGSILLLTGMGCWVFIELAQSAGISDGWMIFFAGLFALSFSHLAVGLINLLAALVVVPRLLPRLDYSKGIDPSQRTLVVIPTLLGNEEDITALVDALEIHYLANRDGSLSFALLTDFPDAAEPTLPDDARLLAHARAGIEILNARYEDGKPGVFYLLHRPRVWNESQECWMGYERKRGKLSALNALILRGAHEPFSETVGDLAFLRAIKFVITLDSDTQLPRDSARLLAGTLAHPLNRPHFDPVRGIVTEGYGVLQPRVGVNLRSAGRSLFVKLFAGEVGIDPYTKASSDLYQDVFDEGTFIGKGIYDVETFEQAAAGRFPENLVLSHDLIEACHARSALVSDVELYENYPSRYIGDCDRQHRWIRGDWQIAWWLWPRVPGPGTSRIPNPLSALSRWKIADNLRRSLVPPALLVFLVGTWLVFPSFGLSASLLVLMILSAAGLIGVVIELVRKPTELPLMMHLHSVAESAGRHCAQIALAATFLPHEAKLCLDATMRTLWRLWISHKRLMAWKTSLDSERTARNDLAASYLGMWAAPALSLLLTGYLIAFHDRYLLSALPWLVLWLAAPLIAWRISLPILPPVSSLSAKQVASLRKTARKTWRFFETFVTAQENWLPPDNFQEAPLPVIASRTSPTNIGLALLANLAARDFGYITVENLIARTKNTFATFQKLEKYRGHLFNWYDTRTLEPLKPFYISSVDSGNLAGHLLTLGPGFTELMEQPILETEIFAGLHDMAAILRDEDMTDWQNREKDMESPPLTLRAGFELLQKLNQPSAPANAPEGTDAEWWRNALSHACQEHFEDLRYLAPWLALPSYGSRATALGADFGENLARLDQGLTLREVAELDQSLCPLLEELLQDLSVAAGDRAWMAELLPCLRLASDRAVGRLTELDRLARQSNELAQMDFTFLFNEGQNVFSIGYNMDARRCDASFYDLLASEARLCSYVAIAQGQVPQDHWFSLGRLLLASHGKPVLASWSGSLFEYLMPLLVMPNYENTLLDQTYKVAVEHQIAHGKAQGIPWGVSESGYNRTDVQFNYQYRAFGVPGLGLKRGLAEDEVIAPYATVMALMVNPERACENLERLEAEGRLGKYGFYEAVDYTPSRLPPGRSSVTIQSFMVHHQGMSLLALDYALRGQPMQRRFSSCPILKATDLLLQERVPNATANVLPDDSTGPECRRPLGEGEGSLRILTSPSQAAPEVHLMSNGRYHVVVSNAGSGYSRWHDLAVTRWREDATRDCWGSFIYLRDTETGEFWSASYQPTLQGAKSQTAIFSQARAEYRQRHLEIEVYMEISVSPEDDVELRRVTLTNHSEQTRTIELTSYAEVVLAAQSADAAHPAFSNLFVQTEFLADLPAILCSRRPRSAAEKPPWLFHLLTGLGGELGEISCETDRARFVGRGRGLNKPAALQEMAPLSNTVGSVLDPIISLRRTVTLAPHEITRLDFIIGVTDRRESAVALAEKYHGARMSDRTLDLAWTHSQVTLRQLNISETEAQLYARLASSLIYANPVRRAPASILLSNRRGQSGLWSYGISGDLPVVLLRINDSANIELVRQLIQAHCYWRMKGLTADLVILNEDDSVYRQPLHDQIIGLITSGPETQLLDKPGGIFVRSVDQVAPEDRTLLQSVARIVLVDENGTLAEQMERPSRSDPAIPALVPSRSPASSHEDVPDKKLVLENGLGGFTPDGREYVVTLRSQRTTPAPWINVLANSEFGTIVSESGSSYTWAENCHEFRLTPWTNDPVSDVAGEFFYIRDEQTGQFWSPTPAPATGQTPYVIRHGFGYSVFEHTENGIASELWIYVATDAPMKFAALKLRNVSGRPRRISVTGYWEWVLGSLRSQSLLHVQTELDPKSGALLARNPYNTEFPERVAFLDVNDPARTFTGDRREFFGRNGTPAQPAALRRTRLSGKVGSGLDPCGAVQVAFDLADGQERETTFRLGLGKNTGEVQALIQRFRRPGAARVALEAVWQYWNQTLGAVQVETPDPAVNIMANGWLLYQTLSCRLWARTGFYQSGGAYGFRDQLQDVMALVHAEPRLVREHILRAAAHQFREGDVQHWWHPPKGQGVRTHFSDDYLWLPFVTCRYVACLGDTGVLDEPVTFLEGRAIRPDEEGYYDLPKRTEDTATLYEHCVRAIEHGLRFGQHGLPLIGCGDWNDGMNMIGKEGRGESVWLAFFLYDVLTQFAALASQRQDPVVAGRFLEQAAQLRKNIELNGWDGGWYRRAYFDNGEPLGSRLNDECQIDSLPQSWSILSGAGDPKRARQAMEAVEKRLVRRESGLIQLFDPPFDRSTLDPGYIKGYIPGVRENGGQYTHAAIWTTMAFALLGDHDRAWELFGMLNPIRHGDTPEGIARYKVEPYVVAADVYGVPPHTGRGGWTWYTGSAGWMYRLLVETLIGVHRKGDHLEITPRLPSGWDRLVIHYRHHSANYHITLIRKVPATPDDQSLESENRAVTTQTIPLTDDNSDHHVEVHF